MRAMFARRPRPEPHPLLAEVSGAHDRIADALREVAHALAARDTVRISLAWDDAVAQVRDTPRALLAIPGGDDERHRIATLAARYLDLAEWMDDNHPRPIAGPDGRALVRDGWQEALGGPDGPFWSQLMGLFADAYRIGTDLTETPR